MITGMEIEEFVMEDINILRVDGKKLPRKWLNFMNFPEKQRFLDIGCGKGYLLFDFLKILPDAEIFGIDISNMLLKIQKKRLRIIY